MNITVNHLEVADIKDKSKTWNESLGANVSVQNSFDTPTSLRLGDPSKGTVNVSASNGGSLVERTTEAMLGKGTIIVGGKTLKDDSPELAKVSRDITKTQIVTTTQTLGGINASLTMEVDSVLHPVESFKESMDALTSLPRNLGLAGTRIGNAVSDVVDAGKAGLTQGVNPFKDYQNSTNFRQATLDFQKNNPELAAVLNNKEKKDSAEYQTALSAYNNYIQHQLGNGSVNTNLYDSNKLTEDEKVAENGTSKEGLGMTDMQTHDVYINAGKIDMSNTRELVGVAGHENIHATGERSEAVAARGETQAQNAWNSENAINGNTTGGGYTNGGEFYQQNQGSQTITQGSEAAAGVRDAAADNAICHGGGGFSGSNKNTAGLVEKLNEDGRKNVINMEFKHSGPVQSDPKVAEELIRNYVHKDKTEKVVWAYSISSDGACEAFGNNVPKESNEKINVGKPQVPQRMSNATDEQTNNPNKKAPEHVDELNLFMPRADYVVRNLKGMSQNADQVNVFVLSKDQLNLGPFYVPGYGDRSYETLQKKLTNVNVPSNVNIIEVENFSGPNDHGRSLSKGSPVLEQLWTQYQEIDLNKQSNQFNLNITNIGASSAPKNYENTALKNSNVLEQLVKQNQENSKKNNLMEVKK